MAELAELKLQVALLQQEVANLKIVAEEIKGLRLSVQHIELKMARWGGIITGVLVLGQALQVALA